MGQIERLHTYLGFVHQEPKFMYKTVNLKSNERLAVWELWPYPIIRKRNTSNRKHRRAAAKPAACAPNAVNTREQGKEGGRVR